MQATRYLITHSRPFLLPGSQLIGWGMIQTGQRLTIGADGNTIPISVGTAAE